MTVKNPDGSNFKVTNTLQQFDPENPELDLFNQLLQIFQWIWLYLQVLLWRA